MKLSLSSEYALLALIHIARKPNSGMTPSEIGGQAQIPAEALHALATVLLDAKYLRCANGKLRLAKPADQVSIAEIIRLFDGALAPLEPVSERGYETAPMEQEPKLTGLFGGLQEHILDKLERTTLIDLV